MCDGVTGIRGTHRRPDEFQEGVGRGLEEHSEEAWVPALCRFGTVPFPLGVIIMGHHDWVEMHADADLVILGSETVQLFPT